MNGIAHEKVNTGHLKRNAYLYIRQSTLRQVIENTESTIRQYDLRQRAVALGWPTERIIVIVSVAVSECTASAGHAAPGREQMMAGSGAHDSGTGFKRKKTR